MNGNTKDSAAKRRMLSGWKEYIVGYELGSEMAIITWKSKRRCLQGEAYLADFLRGRGFKSIIHKTPKRGIVMETRIDGYGYNSYLFSNTDVQSTSVSLLRRDAA
jgi:hypothetical protein